MNIISGWKSLTLRWRRRLVFTGIAVLYTVAYISNFSKTAGVINRYYGTKGMADTIPTSIGQPDFNSVPISTVGQLVSNDLLIKDLAYYSDSFDLSIKEIAQSSFKKDSFSIETNKVIISGTFSDILEFIHHLEYEEKKIPISSAAWEMVRDENNIYTLNSVLYIKRVSYANSD